jgi:hypothetical protein
MNRLATSLFLLLALALPGLGAVGGIVGGTPGGITAKTVYANNGANLYALRLATPAGSTIVVGPGLYTVGVTNLLANGVNWHFMNGAVISNNVGSVHAPCFDNSGSGNNGALTSSITGDLELIYDSNLAVGVVSAPVLISNAQSVVDFQCKTIKCCSGNNYGSALLVWTCLKSDFLVKKRIDCAYRDSGQGNVSGASGMYWAEGETYLRTPEIICYTEAAIWSAGLNGLPANLWVDCNRIVSSNYTAITMQGNSVDTKIWVRANEISGSVFNGVPFGGSVLDTQGGKLYVTANKIFTLGGSNIASGMILNNGGQIWLDCQKVTTTNKEPFFVGSGGESYLRVNQWEDSGPGENKRQHNFSIVGGTNHFFGGVSRTQWGPAFHQTGGQLFLNDMIVNTKTFLAESNACLWITGGTNYLKNCVFVSGSSFSVTNASAGSDLRIRGQLTVNSNITTATLTARGGTVVVDAFTDR